MAFPSNRPTVARLLRQLRVSAADEANPIGLDDVDKIDPDLLADLLESSALHIEDVARTRFDGKQIIEVRDGNGAIGMSTLKWPIGRVREVKTQLPVLALTRIYDASEVKVYRFQGRIVIFTYKLMAEQAGLYLDSQVYGNIFPTMPQCVFITYTYGFPQYDPDNDVTTFDGGATTEPGDTRDDLDVRHVSLLQTAAICDAAASYLAQAAALGIGLVTGVSFDGYSESLNAQAYGPQVQALIERRDELLARRKRGLILATV